MTTPTSLDTGRRPAAHHACFVFMGILSLIVLWAPLTTLLKLALHDDRYSHILIVPLISLALLYTERNAIFSELHFSPLASIPLLVAGLASCWLFRDASSSLNHDDGLSLVMCGVIATWLAGFVFCYGTHCFHAALFPLLFLVLMIPLPPAAIDKTVVILQQGSASTAYGLFRLLGVPVFRSGFTFGLPGVEIEIAKECSGIRSTISLLITGILASHIFLRSGWRKLVLSVLTIPIAIFKNAVRIVTISWLGIYVDRDFLHGTLHRYGGIPFTLIALAFLVPLLILLQKTEANSRDRRDEKSKTISLPQKFQPSAIT